MICIYESNQSKLIHNHFFAYFLIIFFLLLKRLGKGEQLEQLPFEESSDESSSEDDY